MMRLTSASSVTDIMNTIWSAIYSIPYVGRRLTIVMDWAFHHTYITLKRSWREFDVWILIVYSIYSSFWFGCTWRWEERMLGIRMRQRHFGIGRHVGDANSYICTTSMPQWKGTMALRMLPSSNSQIFCFWWQHFGHLQIAAGSSKQSNFWCLKHYKFHLALLRRRNEMKPFTKEFRNIQFWF